jgi:hypothetical protein
MEIQLLKSFMYMSSLELGTRRKGWAKWRGGAVAGVQALLVAGSGGVAGNHNCAAMPKRSLAELLGRP